jgi:hypothetical protein
MVLCSGFPVAVAPSGLLSVLLRGVVRSKTAPVARTAFIVSHAALRHAIESNMLQIDDLSVFFRTVLWKTILAGCVVPVNASHGDVLKNRNATKWRYAQSCRAGRWGKGKRVVRKTVASDRDEAATEQEQRGGSGGGIRVEGCELAVCRKIRAGAGLRCIEGPTYRFHPDNENPVTYPNSTLAMAS